ncbi:Crp/Fnr family transcriptional regulator [Ferruginibacter albus]|uniref:Crp/Fnr family transcriptional regulator n=1 Tax=Ferruginibacter albus TaxID=2875540 RepID=UPI001CC4B984|nr:Crp/Fnr family transcriptional regulator [Ferruginibacter albus]UAY50715.1 Crp/Fnr family transcriptional regulator [Ferruginibacter albus]
MNQSSPTLHIAQRWQSINGHSPMTLFLQQFHPLSKELKKYLDANTFTRKIKKGKHLVRSGETCEHAYLLLHGIMRGYVKDSSKEVTNWIAYENCLVGSMQGFINSATAIKNIQATEDCELVGLHFDCIHYTYKHFDEMNSVVRKILEQYYASAEERALLGRLPSASLRYERFLTMYGHISDRVQLKYVASFLSLAMETLSRIKNGRLKQAV